MRLISNTTGLSLISLHALAAIAWLYAMPGGFPFQHPRFWTNRFLPAALLLLCLIVIVQNFRRDRRPLRLMLLLLAAFWTIFTLPLFIEFPYSARKLMIATCPIAILFWLAAFAPAMRTIILPRWLLSLALSLGFLGGSFIAFSQRAPDPSTFPLNDPIPPLPTANAEPTTLNLGKLARLDLASSEVSLARNQYMITLNPLLTFISRSPDRCWTNLAPRADRLGPDRILRRWDRTSDSIRVTYTDDGRTLLQLRAISPDELEISAWSSLPAPVYSHLNTYTQCIFNGHQRLELLFSPCRDRPIEPLYMQYPTGAPARCAALFPNNIFSVLQATSAEKGPFTTLASGRLNPADPLTVTFRDNGRDVLEISWLDFAPQASLALSPTAGYGLPVNALEFSLADPTPDSPLSIFLTLAGTSLGRGWDSVAHSPGTYRTRLHLHWLPTTSSISTTHPLATPSRP